MSDSAVSTRRDPPEGEPRSAPRGGAAGTGDVVEMRLPATGRYLAVLRTATAGLAARLDFTLDEIEDLRIAVDEACAMLVGRAGAGSTLTCAFRIEEAALAVTVTLPSGGSPPERDTFAWTVLSSLAGEVDAGVDEDLTVWIALRKQRGPTAPA